MIFSSRKEPVAKLGLERKIEVSRSVSGLGVLLGLWPEEEVDQAARRLKIPQ